MERKTRDSIPPEFKLKEPVSWNSMSRTHFGWGVAFAGISWVLIAFLFIELFLKVVMPLYFFEKYIIVVLLLSICLTAISAFNTIFFSYYCGDKYAKNCMTICLATSVPISILNVSVFVWMMATTFNPYALVNIILSLIEALAAFLLNYDMYIVNFHKEKYVIYTKVDKDKDKTKEYLRWNEKDECMEYYPVPIRLIQEKNRISMPEEKKELKINNLEEEHTEKRPGSDVNIDMEEQKPMEIEPKISPQSPTLEEIKKETLEDLEKLKKTKEEGERRSTEEDKLRDSTMIRESQYSKLGQKIKKVVFSQQLDTVNDHRLIKEDGKLEWTNTHFIFAIDSSGNVFLFLLLKLLGSMRGSRWLSVKTGYKKMLTELSRMNNVIVTTFTFAESTILNIEQKSPADALKLQDKIPQPNGEVTDYVKAMDDMVKYMEDVEYKYQGYCRFLIFLSDGGGGYPKQSVAKIVQMKKSGMKIIFYTVAIETDEEIAMTKMCTEIGGEHYKILDQEAAKIAFTQILGA